MRMILAFLLSAALLCGVAGCGEAAQETPSAEDKIIPQYFNHTAAADKGHVLKITVK